MDAYAMAIWDTPAELLRELVRYGGTNPHGKPNWRVVLAQNVLDQSFGVMRHMPCVSAEADPDVEPERVDTGEFWTPRYQGRGWILERWFPATAWGTAAEWEQERAEDGSRRMGEWPRHGEYFMVSETFLEHLPPADHWKQEIQKELRRMAALPGDPAMHLANTLYANRVREERRYQEFVDQVNAVHRQVIEPTLATVGGTAQRIRDHVAAGLGLEGNLAAG